MAVSFCLDNSRSAPFLNAGPCGCWCRCCSGCRQSASFCG